MNSLNAAMRLLDSTVLPHMLYAAPCWALNQVKVVDQVQDIFLRRYLNLPKYTSGFMLRMECGRVSQEVIITKQVLRFWTIPLAIKRFFAQLRLLWTIFPENRSKRWKIDLTLTCDLCKNRIQDEIIHIIFGCSCLEKQRKEILGDLPWSQPDCQQICSWMNTLMVDQGLSLGLYKFYKAATLALGVLRRSWSAFAQRGCCLRQGIHGSRRHRHEACSWLGLYGLLPKPAPILRMEASDMSPVQADSAGTSFRTIEDCFLGHIVNPDGIRPDPSKIEDVTAMPPLSNVKGVRRFMGMVNHLGKYLEIWPLLLH
ncbi:K02A2.6-like [Cordylochernes scorpioides]|uniref:K02A2.6-like n=1 Tax=Cordylochernes scorpioides TaxID=51811 RepID=A0ABY6L815_9ARAC|nr:K02A2.6-like [Cordylochernes scorpioides]